MGVCTNFRRECHTKPLLLARRAGEISLPGNQNPAGEGKSGRRDCRTAALVLRARHGDFVRLVRHHAHRVPLGRGHFRIRRNRGRGRRPQQAQRPTHIGAAQASQPAQEVRQLVGRPREGPTVGAAQHGGASPLAGQEGSHVFRRRQRQYLCLEHRSSVPAQDPAEDLSVQQLGANVGERREEGATENGGERLQEQDGGAAQEQSCAAQARQRAQRSFRRGAQRAPEAGQRTRRGQQGQDAHPGRRDEAAQRRRLHERHGHGHVRHSSGRRRQAERQVDRAGLQVGDLPQRRADCPPQE